jgi:16S rRNA processing protein RimM
MSGDPKAPHGNLVPLGVVVASHGLRGELRVKLHNPDSDVFERCPQVFLRGPAALAERSVTVKTAHQHKPGLVLARIDGCNDRNAADALRGAEICVPRAALPPTQAGEYYLVDFIGLTVVRPDGRLVGHVERVVTYPASQVLRVITEQGVLEIPWFVPYVVEVRLAERRVIVDQLEDLELEPAARRPRG